MTFHIDQVVESLKREEGFSATQYDDHLGNPTIGYGTLLPLTKSEAEMLIRHRLTVVIEELHDKKPLVRSLPENIQGVLHEMAYQMGVPNLMKFVRMWAAIQADDLPGMITEMKDSLWYRQTTSRAERLIERVLSTSRSMK